MLGVARRRPRLVVEKVEWAGADIAVDELVPLFRGSDVVVHLAWLIQPSHDGAELAYPRAVGHPRCLQHYRDSMRRQLDLALRFVPPAVRQDWAERLGRIFS